VKRGGEKGGKREKQERAWKHSFYLFEINNQSKMTEEVIFLWVERIT